EELFACPSCGWCGDRRLNTARVLAQVARGDIVSDASSGGESLNARGGDVRPGALRRGGRSPVKREARARPKSRGEAGTPGPEGLGVLDLSIGLRGRVIPGDGLWDPDARGRRRTSSRARGKSAWDPYARGRRPHR